MIFSTSFSKFSEISTTTTAGLEDVENAAIRKWAAMWRSITLSVLEHTYLPYYSYIHYLDLEGLWHLLCDLAFFTPEIDDYLSPAYWMKGNRWLRSSAKSFDKDFVLLTIGSGYIITTHRTRRHLTGYQVQPSELAEFLQQLPSLQTLSVSSGASLTDHVRDTIRNHCPDLKQLTIHSWDGEQPISSHSHLGPRMIRALGSHWNSLRELKLAYLGITAINELLSLTVPPALKVLVLENTINVGYIEACSQLTPRVAGWISSCKALQQLELKQFMDDELILAQALLEKSLRLSSLSLAGYSIRNASLFHEALHHQPSLQNLYLKGEGSDKPEHNKSLFQAISQLNNLRDLELEGVSDGFTTDDVIALTPLFPNLERLSIGGKYFRDDIWNAFLCLPKLKSLLILGRSEFKAKGVLDFIGQLGPGNRGFSLSILKSTIDTNIHEFAEAYIRDALISKLEEEFETESEIESEDDISE
ncbi:hypothetical protein BDV27DRAFT_144942 [Aspergillus caelatus]|uniref:F-box domain-containing protein n=1 Tax=Aspergillus caelatus TaxID=61420 RepID=A0A5N7A628_9EURO|nr:uncharacterized protein BDV27DRAFT_144942 [Aspergillus caelatus]KAE8364888.1 hypothetical protein BDV27DRAFT_144942 [Aspergillus caelatus]